MSAGAGPVVICCAQADEVAVAEVAKELTRAGNKAEVVAGVEADPKLLSAAIDRCRGEGLYVLCRSRSLDRDAVDELRDVLLAKHVPFGRTLTVASTRARELRERIEAGLRRMAAGHARRMSNVDPSGPPKRRTTQLGVPVDSRAPAPKSSAPVPAAKPGPARTRTRQGIPPVVAARPGPAATSDAGRAVTKIGLGMEPRRPVEAGTPQGNLDRRADAHDAVPPGPASVDTTKMGMAPPPVAVRAEPGAQKRVVDVDALPDEPAAEINPAPELVPRTDSMREIALITSAELSDLASEDEIELSASDMLIDEIRRTGKHTAVPPVVRLPPPPPVRSGDTAVARADQLAGAPAVPPRPAAATGLTPPPTPTPAAARPSPPPATVSPVSSAIGATPPLTPAHAPLPRPVPIDEPQPRRSPWLAIGLGGVGLAAIVVLGVSLSGGGGNGDASEDGASAKKNESADGGGEQDQSGEGPDSGAQGEVDGGELADASVPGARRTLVMDALAERKLFALDILLIMPRTAGLKKFDDAVGHCGGLNVFGLEGWRLPDIGELSSLTRHGMLGTSIYWSKTPGDTFGDTHLAWHGRRKRVVPRYKPSQVICVRGELGDG